MILSWTHLIHIAVYKNLQQKIVNILFFVLQLRFFFFNIENIIYFVTIYTWSNILNL